MLSERHGGSNRLTQEESTSDELMSLLDIMMKKVSFNTKQVELESYIRLSNILEEGEDNEYCDQTIIVKRMNLTFCDKDCRVLNFTDFTTYKKLKREEEKSKLLSLLNHSVHHEMIGPLKANVEFSKSLKRKCDNKIC